MRKNKTRKVFGLSLAALMATSTLAGGFAPAAHAAVGGGAVGGGGGVGAGARYFHIFNHDDAEKTENPEQGWGQNSIDYFKRVIDSDLDARVGGHNPLNPFYRNMDTACSTAINEAVARNPQANKARVVQVAFAWDNVPGANAWATWGATADFFKQNYDKYVDGSVADGLKNYTSENLELVKDVARHKADQVGSNIRLVCVALNDQEPAEPPYSLSLSTTAQATFPVAGGTEPVHDSIRSSAGGSSIRENLKGNVLLNWVGPDGATKSASKPVTLSNVGTTKSAEFIPKDFGWETWPSGKFGWDVHVPKQGKMAAAIDTPDWVPTETWQVATPPPEKKLATTDGADLAADAQLASDQSYVAKIKAHSAGYGTFKIIDTITTDQVEVNADDVYVENASGEKVKAEVAIDRDSKPGNVIVSATLDTKDKSGWYTLNVPTKVLPTGENYDVPDTSAACYGSAFDTCLTGNPEETTKVTPKPDKVWALDETGALQLYDKEWTNTVGADTKTFAPGSDISAVVNGHIGRGLPYELASYEIVDDWSDAAKYIDLSDTSRTKVYFGQTNVTDEFEITSANGITEAKAKPAFLARTKGLVSDMDVKLVLSGQFRNDYDTDGKLVEMLNAGHETWNNEEKPTNKPPVFTETPKPDKVWTLDQDGALRAYDREWTNMQGSDNAVFLPNELVSAVVNGKVPANLGQALKKYEIVDDWSDAAKYIDFTDASAARVYFDGQDVTDQFEVRNEGTTTIASAKDSFLARTKDLAKDTEVKLIINGRFRTDYETHGNKNKMINKGHETWNNKGHETNEPPVFTWTPDPKKEVLASASQGGDQSNIHQLGVWPGQIIEYKVDVDLNLPDGMARGDDSVQSLAVEDEYDPQFIPNRKSVEFYDVRNNKVIPRSAYKLEFNDAEHKFTATFKEDWVKKNVKRENNGWLILRFDGKVADDTTPGSTVKNQAFEILNGARASTNIPEVKIPKVEPHKEDLNTNNVDINGKTVVQGDTIRYRLTLDGGMPREKLAYDVHKFGMIDDFDEEYLDVAPENIKVTTLDGADVTDKFNIQVRDGKFYVFAKHVDHTNNEGDLVKGVQPENLAEYVDRPIDPINDPIIDQALLGKKYYVIADATVKKEKDGYVIKNTAWQNTENSVIQTEIVSNPLKDIDPVKDVVVSEETNNDSINGKEVKLNDLFNYRLTSSEIPANRAYEASQWSIRDTFDPKFDSYTGKWAVYADTDIYDGEKLVYKTGDLLADGLGKMFNVTWDEASHTINAEATADFLKLVNTRGDLSAKWSIYVKMERIAPSEKITNTHIETYNKIERNSNEVWTSTPENPAIDVEKFTYAEGEQKGDRDDVKDAYKLRKDTRVGFVVRNSGDVALTNVTLTDKTLEGTTGELSKVTCGPATEIGEVKAKADTNGGVSSEKVDGLNVGDLAVGQQVTCSADLVGVTAGETHSDNITGEGTSIFTGKKVTDADPWHGKSPAKKALPTTGAEGAGLIGLVGVALAGVALASRRALGAIKKD